MSRRIRAQSILEYTLVFAAITAATIFAIRIFSQNVTTTYTAAGNVLDHVASEWETQFTGGSSD